MKNLRGSVAFALVLGALPCLGAYDAFLKIDGIKGEATDAAHNGWIEIAGFSWGMTNPTTSMAMPAKSNTQGCATNEVRFSVRGAAIVPMQKLVMQGAHLQSVALDVNGQRHVLDGATITSCQNNLCVMRFLRCATHSPAAVNASMLNRNAIQTQPNASFSLGDDPAQEVSIIAVHPGGSNDVLITERGASP